jgi:ssDNA-binding Zn-finger/Zn-ribbon topoisomerase 1
MFTEIKYLNFLSTRLDRFKHKKEFLWNFRCPICGDSQRHKNKARGFVFQVKGKLYTSVTTVVRPCPSTNSSKGVILYCTKNTDWRSSKRAIYHEKGAS